MISVRGGFASPNYGGSVKQSASIWVRETVALIFLDFPKRFQSSPLPSALRCHGIRRKVLAQIGMDKKQEGTLSRRYKADVSRGWRSRMNRAISVRAHFCFDRSRAAQPPSRCCPPPQRWSLFPCSSCRAAR